jgi:hypothetical protein
MYNERSGKLRKNQLPRFGAKKVQIEIELLDLAGRKLCLAAVIVGFGQHDLLHDA